MMNCYFGSTHTHTLALRREDAQTGEKEQRDELSTYPGVKKKSRKDSDRTSHRYTFIQLSAGRKKECSSSTAGLSLFPWPGETETLAERDTGSALCGTRDNGTQDTHTHTHTHQGAFALIYVWQS